MYMYICTMFSHFSGGQAEYYRSKNIVIDVWEQGSLFLGVSQHKAERSVLAACKYLVNHIFEMYGIEVSYYTCIHVCRTFMCLLTLADESH